LFGAVFLLLLTGSCRKDLPEPIPTPDRTDEQAEGLGEKLENPYSVKNMKRAVRLLMSVAPDAGHPDPDGIQPTHRYVRFLPKDTADIDLLDQDTVLILSTVPYGYQNSMDLDYYHDPSIPADEPTWLYTIAPVEYELPEVHHEILEEAYLPEDDEDELDLLALKLTGNLPDEIIDGRELMSADLTDRELLGIFSRRYNPSGRILVSVIDDYGNRGNPVPVKNADIIVRTFWLSRHVTTNDNGDYYLHKRYKDRAAIRLSNRNPLCYVSRNWTEHIGLWMSDKIGEGKANLHIVIEQQGDNHRWYKAAINNAFQDYDKFARENGIPRPWRVHTYLLAGQEVSYAKYTAVAEAWSHFVERDLMWKLYKVIAWNGNMTAYATEEEYPYYTEARRVGSVEMAKWIPSGVFKDLIDDEQNTIKLYDQLGQNILLEGVDKVSGFTCRQMFNLLTDEVRSIQQLRDKIISRYPHKNLNNEITNLFKYYGY